MIRDEKKPFTKNIYATFFPVCSVKLLSKINENNHFFEEIEISKPIGIFHFLTKLRPKNQRVHSS